MEEDMRRNMKNMTFSHAEVSEEIDMLISKDRIIYFSKCSDRRNKVCYTV